MLTPELLCGQNSLLETGMDISMRLDEQLLLHDFLNRTDKTKHLWKGLKVLLNFLLKMDNLLWRVGGKEEP